MTALKNNIAMHEIHVARYYIKRHAYIAAAQRAITVIEKYQKTPAVPHALEVLQEAYTKLGLKDLANDAKRVYEFNYPNGAPIQSQENITLSHRLWDFIGFDK
jgi:outer membrane protein assembly factor BamD